MTPQEANEIIAEFMGGPYIGDSCVDDEMYYSGLGISYEGRYCKGDFVCPKCKNIPKHYLSLDALVPVLEKLKDKDFECFCWLNINKGTNSCEWKMNGRHDIEENESPSVALAIATAKAIVELGN